MLLDRCRPPTATRSPRPWLGGALALASLAGCPQEGPRADANAPTPAAGSATSATGRAAPVASVASVERSKPPRAQSSGAALEIPPPRLRDRPRRAGAPGSTRGTVACGATRCTSPDACAWDDATSAWRCGPARPGDFVFACDDGTDCPQGETCCRVFESSATDHGTCVARAEVDRRCSDEICLQGGAKCPAGRACTSQSPDDAGSCEAPKGPATCTGKKPCPAERPICTMQDAGLACVEAGSPAYRGVSPERRWQCTRPEDCSGGDTCFLAFGERANELGTVCGRWSASQSGARICDATGPSPCGADAKCPAATECRLLEGGSAWMGVLEAKR